MKKNLIQFLLLILCNSAVFADNLEAFVTINRFYEPQSNEHYIEISYYVPANLVVFKKNEASNFQAKLKTSILIENTNEVINSKRYILQTKEYNSLSRINSNLQDVVRLSVPSNDTFSLSITIEDLQTENSKFTSTSNIFINKKPQAFLSDIMLATKVEDVIGDSPFNRNGKQIVPKFLNYYPTEITKVQFYCEFYQVEKPLKNYFVRYLLTNEEGLYVNGYASHKRLEKSKYEAIVSGFDISKLPSGNYYLYVELKDSENEIIERKRTFFQRNNKSKNIVENIHAQKNELEVLTNNFAKKYNLANIKHHIDALAPIADSFEKATISSFEQSEDLVQMQNYFFSFWKERNTKSPEAEWMAYAKKLQYVENTFTNIDKRGYQTDRGILYLMYGEPFYSKLHRRSTMGEFWVWNYETIENQGNVFFIFLNIDNISDNFELVHTSKRGELYNKRWAEFIKDNL